MGERKPYNEPCKKCGSTDQIITITNGKKSIYCRNCSNFEDIYVSSVLQKQWDNEAKQNIQQQTVKEQHSSKPIVECPYCHSTNTKKISVMSKASSVALVGIFAMGKVNKQWHCNQCKSDF